MRSLATIDAHAASRASRKELIEQAIFFAFLAGLAWTPFWYGSNDLAAWGVNALLFPGLAGIYEASILVRKRQHPVGVTTFAASAVMFLIVVLWIFLQCVTWLPAALTHPIWSMASEALDMPLAGSVSVDRDLTILALVRLITSASVFWIAVQLCRDAGRAVLLIQMVAAICAFYVVYAFVTSALQAGRLPSFGAPSTAPIASTFINRNSFATYAGIGLIAVCGLILRLYRRELGAVSGSYELQLASFIETTGQKGVALFAGAALLLIAVFLTGSRGGFVAAGAAMLVLFVLSVGSKERRASQIQVVAFGTVLIGAVFLAYGDVIAGRIASSGFTDASRMSVYLITLWSILDRPFAGHGYGSFVDVFPMYRDRSISVQGIWEQAHNTYLEIFQGLGLVFGSLLVVSVSLLVLACARGGMSRRRNEMIPRIAASVSVLVGVQALVDFSLQIQAVAITFMAILGAGVAQSQSSRLSLGDRREAGGEVALRDLARLEGEADRREKVNARPYERMRDSRIPVAITVIALCGFAVFRGVDIVRFTIAKSGLEATESQTETLLQWASVPGLAFYALEAALRRPVDPLNIEAARGRRDQFAATLAVRPLASLNWLSLAGMRYATGQPSSDTLKALTLSSVTGPNEGYIMSQRAIFELMQWDGLPADAKRRAVGDFVTAFRKIGLTNKQRTTAASVLAGKGQDARSEIIELLRSEGLSATDLDSLGLGK